MLNWQRVIAQWVASTFGDKHIESTLERSSRFFEEAVELCQSVGLRKELAQEILDDVYSKEPGEEGQEFGGTIVTLLALAHNRKKSVLEELQRESDRIHKPEVIEKCRAKQAIKKSKGLGI